MTAFLKLMSNGRRPKQNSGMLFGHETIAKAVEEMNAAEPEPRRVPENPRHAPRLDPVMERKLEEIDRRISRRLRWHFMLHFGCWSIQMFDHKTNDWNGVAIIHEDDAMDPKGRPGFKQPDERDLIKFCHGWLEIRYGTGDVDKDFEFARADKDAYAAGMEKDRARRSDHVFDLILSQGDIKRTQKVGQHLAYHGTNAGFKEVFQVPRSAPLDRTSPLVVVKR